MKLKYHDNNNQPIILEWLNSNKGLELLIKGPGFSIKGFSIGFYSAQQLQSVLDRFINQQPVPKYDWSNHPQLYPPIYTFTKPIKFAPRQGHATRLAIHADKWEIWEVWDSFSLRSPRTITIHEQGERTWWRWLGRYRFWDTCEFLKHGITRATNPAVSTGSVVSTGPTS